ncbi:MAG: methylmalonyl-CoA mutase family protein [Bacteroidota bacterium]
MEKALFSDFSPASKSDWQQRILKELKGRPIEALDWAWQDGIVLSPFVHREEVSEDQKAALGAGLVDNSWSIGEDFEVEAAGEKAVNQLLMEALVKGVDAPRLVFGQSHPPADWDWALALKGVVPDYIYLNIEAAQLSAADLLGLMQGLVDVWQQDGRALETLRGALQSNCWQQAEESSDLAAYMRNHLPQFHLFTIDGRAAQQGPEQLVSELHQIVRSAVDQMDRWTEYGWTAAQVSEQVCFRLAVGTSYFPEIAKIRALHLLWANVLAAYGLPPSRARIEAELSASSQGENTHTNMIRMTTQAMSAVIGGVARLYLQAANSTTEGASPFTRRIARNVHHILRMESFLDGVVDPAAGSYYIERMSVQLAEAVWKKM